SGKQGAWIFTAAHGAILGPFPDTLTPGTAPYIPPPTPTLAQQAAAMIAAGLGITSTGTPALNGTYSVDATAQHNIQAVQIYIQANGKFPGSSGTYAWLDKAGAPHAFPTVAEFTAFATAVADFVADLQMIIYTGTGTLPADTATIP
ncbi:MAG: hypothetical protein KGH75_09310, partial [Rhodospirillales bacterium]|nr:hypothetical protein [Rhodospirillales bacterium]